jgi:asparagine synthase (glutamine-hydrolysing)
MSIIFGIMESEGPAIEERQLLDLAYATDRYAPDGTFVHGGSLIGMGFQPYHTHQRSITVAICLPSMEGSTIQRSSANS